MKSLLLISLLVFSIICSADIYMQTDKNGNQSYSDTPSEGATRVILPNSNATSSTNNPKNSNPTTTTTTTTTATSATATTTYTDFLIDSPLDKQTITNQPSIPVELLVKPQLQKGDKTQIYLDGAAQGDPVESTHHEMTNIPRGAHQLSAVLLDKNNNTLKQSQTVTIYVFYAHIGGAAPPT